MSMAFSPLKRSIATPERPNGVVAAMMVITYSEELDDEDSSSLSALTNRILRSPLSSKLSEFTPVEFFDSHMNNPTLVAIEFFFNGEWFTIVQYSTC